MRDASWIIEDTTTHKAIFETCNFELCQFINTNRYRVWPAAAWLFEVNRRIRLGGI